MILFNTDIGDGKLHGVLLCPILLHEFINKRYHNVLHNTRNNLSQHKLVRIIIVQCSRLQLSFVQLITGLSYRSSKSSTIKHCQSKPTLVWNIKPALCSLRYRISHGQFRFKMISTVESPKNADHSSSSSVRRKPLQLLTGIFCRKNRREDSMSTNGSDIRDYITDDTENDIWASSDGPIDIPEPREALHSPYHARTIDQDMENLRLSRQDNPYLQVLASRECLNESDDCSEYEEKHLMSKENMSGGSRDPLTIAEVHARLVRSPPPVMWTRSRNSEPSFSHLTSHSSVDTDCVFRFPPVTGRLLGPDPSPTHSCRSHHSSSSMPGHKLLGPFEYNSRIRDNTLEAVTGKFNLSPQPRRRPESKARPFTDFS